MSSQLWWYVARAGGLTAWALSAASVLGGLALSGKALDGRVRPNWQLDLHRFIGGLTVIFTIVHVIGLVADSYVHFGVVETLVPFASEWQPAAVAWGVIAAYLLVAVEVTSLLRSKIPKRVWRAVHLSAYALYGFGTLHALTAGTDTSGTVFPVLVAITTIAIAALTIRRIGELAKPATPRVSRRAESAAGAPTGAAVLGQFTGGSGAVGRSTGLDR
jgi:predicted ferric reductase